MSFWIIRSRDLIELRDAIHALAGLMIREFDDMQPAMERLASSVEQNTRQGDSLAALVSGLAEQIRNAAGDPSAINKIADDLDNNTQRWASIVTANTPQAGGGAAGGGAQP